MQHRSNTDTRYSGRDDHRRCSWGGRHSLIPLYRTPQLWHRPRDTPGKSVRYLAPFQAAHSQTRNEYAGTLVGHRSRPGTPIFRLPGTIRYAPLGTLVPRMEYCSLISQTNNAFIPRKNPEKNWVLPLEKMAPPLLGLVIGLAVCIPFLRNGYLLLLDWVIGPHTPIIAPSFYGLQGGINESFLYTIVAGVISHAFGAAATWIPIFLFFPLACASVSRAVRGSILAKLAAALFFSINPFVVERLYAGQLAVLYGYILLPLLYIAVEKWVKRDAKTITHVALILTLMISVDVHYAWIGGLVILVGIIMGLTDRSIRKSVLRLLVLVLLLNIYLVIPVLGQPFPVNSAESQALLKAFSTRGDPRFGLYVNVLGLFGFWRQMPETSKSLVSGWPILLLAILLLTIYGFKTLWDRNDKKLALLIGISFVAAFFLAIGTRGPTGSIFNLLYEHLPGFSMMREPEKFSAILATGTSILLGEGLASISLRQTTRNATIALIAVGAVLELSYNPIIFWGIHGQVQTSTIPQDWSSVADKLHGAQGNVLVLPWHQYLSFPFTQKRIIANPAPRFLPANTISGDNVQIGPVYTTSTSPRSAYITWLTSNENNTSHFGKLLAPIGVQYILILKTYSTGPTTWINHQKDLKVIYSSRDIELVHNQDFAGLAQAFPSSPPAQLPTSLSQLNPHDLVRAADPNTVERNSVFVTRSHTSISYETRYSGWLAIDTTFDPRWLLNKHPATQTPFGTSLFRIHNTRGTIEFAPWNIILLGYSTSALTLLIVTSRSILKRTR